MIEESKWPYFSKRLVARLEEKEITLYRLEEVTRDRKIKLRSSNMSKVKAGKKRPTDDILKALSEYERMGMTLEELKGWRAIDEIGLEALFEAYKWACRDALLAGETMPDSPIKWMAPAFLLRESKLLRLSADRAADEFTVFPGLKTFPEEIFYIKVVDESQWPYLACGSEILACPASAFKPQGWYLISEALSIPDGLQQHARDSFPNCQFHFARLDQNEKNLQIYSQPTQAPPCEIMDATQFNFNRRVVYEILLYRVIKG